MLRFTKNFHLYICALLTSIPPFTLHCREIEQPLAAPMGATTVPGGMGFKSDDVAMQEEFNQILEELNQMPEDKLQELERQLQAEVKRELESMTPERRAEFDREMGEFWRSQGVDPSQLPSLDEMLGLQKGDEKITENPPYEPVVSPEATAKKESALPSDYLAEEAQEIIGKLIDSLESLRRKMAAYPQITRKLQAWKEAIDDLVYYLKVMDQPEHHARVAAKEFIPLLKNLKTLQKELSSAEPQLASNSKKDRSAESPYEVLRMEPTATDAELKARYDAYSAENDPATLRTRLSEEGFDESEIEGRIKAAKLQIRTVKDAYEKISNPKIRAQTDRALAAAYEQSHLGEEKSRGALNAILNALSQAVYQKNIIEDMQRFMKKYEPAKFEQRKKMEEAERKQRKEQEAASKLKPTVTPASPEPYYLPGSPSYQAPSGYYPGYGYGYGQQAGAPTERSYGKAIEPTKAPDAGGKSGGGKSGGAKENKDEGKKDEKAPAAKEDKGKDKKSPASEWSEALQALNKELDLVDSDIVIYDSTAAQKVRPQVDALAQLQAELHAAAAKAPSDEEVVEAQEEAVDAQEAPELPAAPTPEQIKQLHELTQSITTVLESAKHLESAEKAMSKFAKINKKAEEEKTKIQNKEKLIADLSQKPAMKMIMAIAQTPPPAPVRGKAPDLFATAPKTKKLVASVHELIGSLMPAQEKAA